MAEIVMLSRETRAETMKPLTVDTGWFNIGQ